MNYNLINANKMKILTVILLFSIIIVINGLKLKLLSMTLKPRSFKLNPLILNLKLKANKYQECI